MGRLSELQILHWVAQAAQKVLITGSNLVYQLGPDEDLKMIMTCNVHGETEFRNESRSAKRFRCRKCLSEAFKRRRREAKKRAVEYFGGSCKHCGYNRCIQALEFHHLDPNEKDFALSDSFRTGAIKDVKEELDKCILLCSNCHREEHYKLGL